MPLIYNTTEETQSTKAAGNWFTLKPGQTKMVNDNIAHFISQERRETGIVVLPVEFDEPEHRLTDEGKAQMLALKEEGIRSFVAGLESRVRNNQVSLRRDLERANIKVDPAIEASSGEMEAYKLLAKYKKSGEDQVQKRKDEVAELLKQIGSS